MLDVEAGLLRKFQRHGHLYEGRMAVPDHDNVLEWLALMQHYGAPTRLLDWSYSFWVALFFACENAHPDASSWPAVWALNSAWLKERSLAVLRAGPPAARYAGRAHLLDLHCKRKKTFEDVYRNSHAKFAFKQNCWRLNERLVAQQAVFVCPGDPNVSFQENIEALGPGGDLRKLIIDPKLVPRVHRELREMNITAATIYLGLEGFARSLGALGASPEVIKPDDVDPWSA
jgi:hypothetical protein